MTTPIRPYRERRQASLSMGAMRWLLGAESRIVGATGAVRNSSIVRWRYLIAHKPNTEDWAEYVAEFWGTHRNALVARHIQRWPGTRPIRWWMYDAPEPLRDGESEYEYLRRHKLLTPAEKRHGSGRRAS
jgi:hypothetical protein